MDAYFASFPAIREYLDNQVGRATVEGFTETILGRRRYIPELQAANPRVRDLGRRQALNAPIQGSASDVFKMAMIRVDEALREQPELDCHMLLTVHDELVFEVPEANVEAAAELVAGSHGARRRARGAAAGRRRLGARTGPTRRRPATDPSGCRRLTGFPPDTYPVTAAGSLVCHSHNPKPRVVSPARRKETTVMSDDTTVAAEATETEAAPEASTAEVPAAALQRTDPKRPLNQRRRPPKHHRRLPPHRPKPRRAGARPDARGADRGARGVVPRLQRRRHRRGRGRQDRPRRGAAGHRLQVRGRDPVARSCRSATTSTRTRS